VPVYVVTSHIADKQVTKNDFTFKSNLIEIFTEPPCDTEFRQIRTSRFRIAADLADKFDVIGILDADMVVIRDLTPIFALAHEVMLFTGNNTLLTYRHKDFERMQLKSPGPDTCTVFPTFCTVPTFINPKKYGNFLQAIWGADTNPTGNDLESINLLTISMNLMNSMYLLNTYQFSNIHHSMLKPETFVKMTPDGLYSHQGQPVYSLHGHWLDDRYVNDLIEPMIKNYAHIPKAIDTAKNCINDICKIFKSYAM
jgi:hypothetical protein